MIDIQNEAEGCGIPLNYVGVSDFKIPIRINKQPTIFDCEHHICLLLLSKDITMLKGLSAYEQSQLLHEFLTYIIWQCIQL